MRIAVLDLGSTSFRFALVDVDGEGRIVERSRKRAALNLGLVVGRKGRVPEPYAAAAVDTLVRFRTQAERSGAERVITVATSALRDASDREELARRFELAVGHPVRFLKGEEEAILTFAGLCAGLQLRERVVLGLDLGGGSLELVVGDGSCPVWVKSLPLGAGRLTGMFVHHDPIRRTERKGLQASVNDSLLAVTPEVLVRRPETCIAAGGTVKAIARLITSGASDPRGSLHGTAITARQLHRIRDRLATSSRSERLQLPGVGRHRVDTIAAGAVVLSSVVDLTGRDDFIVSEWGLREGIVLESLGLMDTTSVSVHENPALARSG